jgi:hypothetical protein
MKAGVASFAEIARREGKVEHRNRHRLLATADLPAKSLKEQPTAHGY